MLAFVIFVLVALIFVAIGIGAFFAKNRWDFLQTRKYLRLLM